MNSPDVEGTDVPKPDDVTAFRRRTVQIAFRDRIDRGLEPLYVYQLQRHGLLPDVASTILEKDVVPVLMEPSHPMRAPGPEGPLVFVNQARGRLVVDARSLVLNPDLDSRRAAVDYLWRGTTSGNPWLTSRSREALEQRKGDCSSAEYERWTEAGIEVTEVVRRDLFAHVAALRQSLVLRYDDGFNEHALHVLRPPLDFLAELRPPVWNPTEQLLELSSWIEEFGELPSIVDAVTAYVQKCGYLPLCSTYGASAVVRTWLARHENRELEWSELQSWVEASGKTTAEYHACCIAMDYPGVFNVESAAVFWKWVRRIVSVAEAGQSDSATSALWELRCELALHYAQHIDALLPGQDGERIACYAWWLADIVGAVLAVNDTQAEKALQQVVRPERLYSNGRWTISRSPVVPSLFRYSTLFNTSVWAISLLAQMARCNAALPLQHVPADLVPIISRVLRGSLLVSPLGRITGISPVFAFQENDALQTLLSKEEFVPVPEQQVVGQILTFRNEMLQPPEFRGLLESLKDSPPHIQHIVVYFLASSPEFVGEFWSGEVG